MINLLNYRIIDISQPIASNSAYFPGDTPFSKAVTLSCSQKNSFNLTAMTLSPHVGTHADAPSHIAGDILSSKENIGFMPLEPYLGPALVVDVSDFHGEITYQQISPLLAGKNNIERILVKTLKTIRYDVFEEKYAYFSSDLVEKLAKNGVKLLGIDTPSVDYIHSKELSAHHSLDNNKMLWLENLDLTKVDQGMYFLVALPLKFMELEASPLRAILLTDKK